MSTHEPSKTVQLGDKAPNFTAETSEGKINFYDYIGTSWCILFSHPKDFTPVCTTELGLASRLINAFSKRNVKLIGLSVDDLHHHNEWISDINKTQNTQLNFPLIADTKGEISELYGMIHPKADNTLTVRALYIIDPNKTIRLMITYPASTGRNFDEILRVIDSLQLTDNYCVATPANWKDGDDCVIIPSITDEQELKEKFPSGWQQIKPYLRLTPQPNK